MNSQLEEVLENYRKLFGAKEEIDHIYDTVVAQYKEDFQTGDVSKYDIHNKRKYFDPVDVEVFLLDNGASAVNHLVKRYKNNQQGAEQPDPQNVDASVKKYIYNKAMSDSKKQKRFETPLRTGARVIGKSIFSLCFGLVPTVVNLAVTLDEKDPLGRKKAKNHILFFKSKEYYRKNAARRFENQVNENLAEQGYAIDSSLKEKFASCKRGIEQGADFNEEFFEKVEKKPHWNLPDNLKKQVKDTVFDVTTLQKEKSANIPVSLPNTTP